MGSQMSEEGGKGKVKRLRAFIRHVMFLQAYRGTQDTKTFREGKWDGIRGEIPAKEGFHCIPQGEAHVQNTSAFQAEDLE